MLSIKNEVANEELTKTKRMATFENPLRMRRGEVTEKDAVECIHENDSNPNGQLIEKLYQNGHLLWMFQKT